MIDPPFRKHPAHLIPPPYACKRHNFEGTPREYFTYQKWVRDRYTDGEVQECCPYRS